MTSVSEAWDAFSARPAIASTTRLRCSPCIADTDADVAESRGGGAVARRGGLHRLPLPAVGEPPQGPLRWPAHGVARSPELGGGSSVGGVLQETDAFPVLDLPAVLGPELEVQTPVVDAPGTVVLHEDPVARVCDDRFELSLAGEQAHVRHADERKVTPPIRPHRSVAFALPDDGRRLARGQIAAEDPFLDDVRASRRNPFIVEA